MVKLGFRSPDIGDSRRQLAFRLADIGTVADEIGRNAGPNVATENRLRRRSSAVHPSARPPASRAEWQCDARFGEALFEARNVGLCRLYQTLGLNDVEAGGRTALSCSCVSS